MNCLQSLRPDLFAMSFRGETFPYFLKKKKKKLSKTCFVSYYKSWDFTKNIFWRWLKLHEYAAAFIFFFPLNNLIEAVPTRNFRARCQVDDFCLFFSRRCILFCSQNCGKMVLCYFLFFIVVGRIFCRRTDDFVCWFSSTLLILYEIRLHCAFYCPLAISHKLFPASWRWRIVDQRSLFNWTATCLAVGLGPVDQPLFSLIGNYLPRHVKAQNSPGLSRHFWLKSDTFPFPLSWYSCRGIGRWTFPLFLYCSSCMTAFVMDCSLGSFHCALCVGVRGYFGRFGLNADIRAEERTLIYMVLHIN